MTATRHGDEPPRRRRPSARTAQARENQMISLAVDVAEEQMRKGEASAQVIVHYLKLATNRDKLEQELLKERVILERAKTEAMAQGARIEELYDGAIKAMKAYQGGDDPVDEEDD